MREQLKEYIFEKFNIDNVGRRIIVNIVDWVYLQSMDKADTISCLMELLDGIGITEEELGKFVED